MTEVTSSAARYLSTVGGRGIRPATSPQPGCNHREPTGREHIHDSVSGLRHTTVGSSVYDNHALAAVRVGSKWRSTRTAHVCGFSKHPRPCGPALSVGAH